MPKHLDRTINVKEGKNLLFADAQQLCCSLLQGWQTLIPTDIEVEACCLMATGPAQRN